MSFFLQLDVDGLTAEQGLLIEAKCREVGAWPVRFRPQRRRFITLGTRSSQPELSLPDADSGRHILSDHAEWDAPSWAMEPSLLPRLATAIQVLGDQLPQGFALRATWTGSEVRHEREVTVNELADLALTSQLNEFTRYRVPPQNPTGSSAPIDE